jgi:multidrug efflux pump subunit AcrA (membrane-fusion protein)
MADVGQFLSPGFAVAMIYAIDYVEVRLPIPDSELAYLDLPLNHPHNKSSQHLSEVLLHTTFAGERQEWNGLIVRAEGEIDPVSRMVHVVAQVDDPYGNETGGNPVPLSVGLFVEAEIKGHDVENAVVIPRSSVRNGNQVLVLDEENRLRFRDVEILRFDKAEAIITGGLVQGERVCISSLEAVTDGMKVRASSDKSDSDKRTEGRDST